MPLFKCLVGLGRSFVSSSRPAVDDREGTEKAPHPDNKQYPIELVDADQKLTYEAAKLKGRYKIAYADCFAAALSHRLNAVVVTGDPEFKKLGDEYSIQWLKTKSS